ncbi:MAG: DUF4418 family protein [Oscillospiraceae bacterium]|nr:DUF4418 family protein [Oscillospiraceae bacterium]
MEKKTSGISVMDVVLLVLSLAFFLGVLFVFDPCGPKEDGGWMTCHWAGRAVSGVAGAVAVTALIHFFAGDGRVKMGLDLAILPMALLAALIPGRLIGLCMMADMRCRSVMAPAVTVFSVLLIAAAVIDLLIRRKSL